MNMNAEEHILESYKTPHPLKFPPKDGDEDYRYPEILTDNRVRDSVTRSAADWSKPKPDLKAEAKVEVSSSIIDVLRIVLDHSLQKFRYGETPHRYWARYFRFSGDQFDERARRTYRWTESNQRVWVKGAYVNTNRLVAIDWLRSEFLPLILNSETAHTALLVGSPGSGKSTFLKYLLTVHCDEFHGEEVIASRFEFMKFLREMQRTDLIGSLQRYLSFIHLRDLFLHHFFIKKYGRWEIKFNYLSHSKLDDELSAVSEAWSENCTLVGVKQSGDPIKQLRELFEASKGSTQEYSRVLRGLSHDRRLALLLGLNRQGMRVLTIIDGVDYVSIEDMIDKNHLKPIMMQILGARAEICSYFSPGLVKWSTASIIVIRENTLGLLDREPEVSRVYKDIYQIGQIDTRVALLNAIQRSLDTAYINHKFEPNPLDASRLMRAVEKTVATLAASSGRTVMIAEIYEMFCGNLRHILEFLRVLFEWIVTETIREKILIPPFSASLSEVIERLTSLAALKIVRRRSYRMIELILLPRFGWFENGFRVVERDPFVDAGASATAARILGNETHHGFVDNIFNYHTVLSPPVPDSHASLKKSEYCRYSDAGTPIL